MVELAISISLNVVLLFIAVMLYLRCRQYRIGYWNAAEKLNRIISCDDLVDDAFSTLSEVFKIEESELRRIFDELQANHGKR